MAGVQYNVRVHLDGELGREVVDAVLDELAPFGAVVAADAPGRTAVVLTVDEPTLRAAVDFAFRQVEGSAGAHAVSVEALPTVEFDAR